MILNFIWCIFFNISYYENKVFVDKKKEEMMINEMYFPQTSRKKVLTRHDYPNQKRNPHINDEINTLIIFSLLKI